MLALDTATRQRLGDNCLAAVGNAKVWINIDHHPSNPRYGDLVHIDPIAPATGQILFELLQSQDLPLDERDRGKSFRRDFDRHRLVSISEYDRAHF